jgi:hypothetical protein
MHTIRVDASKKLVCHSPTQQITSFAKNHEIDEEHIVIRFDFP